MHNIYKSAAGYYKLQCFMNFITESVGEHALLKRVFLYNIYYVIYGVENPFSDILLVCHNIVVNLLFFSNGFRGQAPAVSGPRGR